MFWCFPSPKELADLLTQLPGESCMITNKAGRIQEKERHRLAWLSVNAEGELRQTTHQGKRSADSSGSVTPKRCALRFLPGDKYHLNLQASGTNVWWLLWAIVL